MTTPADSQMRITIRDFGPADAAAVNALALAAFFAEIAVVRDRFRIGGQSIDDVIMTLDLSTRSAR